MTTPNTGAQAASQPVAQPKAESFLDWFQINSRMVTAGAVLVGVAGLGLWYANQYRANQIASADRELTRAKQSIGAGNAQLAQTDLQRVADKYGNRPAGVEAAILLAQLHLEKNELQPAIDGLKKVVGDAGPNESNVRALMAEATWQAGKAADAAAEFERAAKVAVGPIERAALTAKAARAYQDAGNATEAKRLWDVVANQTDDEGLAVEARVRLGELASGVGATTKG